MTRQRDEDGWASTWWGQYAESLAASGIPRVSRRVIEADSRYIVERGVLGAGDAGDDRWPDGRVRRGVVMGAVQSGKTASMMGVAAMSLDAGVDMVLVLAGTRVSLWRQSLDRLVQQLDRPDRASAAERGRRRVLVPDPALAMNDDADRSPARLYSMSGPTLRRAVTGGRPVMAVVLKNVHHLRAMSDVIRARLIPAIASTDRPFHMLVLDDEADDGSILDARVEQLVDPAYQDLKQIPRAIVDQWEMRPHNGHTATPQLFATYVGYTATPQANFLQSDHNPLAPTHFAIALRTPADQGEIAPRSTSYREPSGLAAFYTGGEAYYNRVPGSPLCRATTGDPSKNLAEALRAFLMAGAIRLWRQRDRMLPTQARETEFNSRLDAATRQPKPHSMLFHPSASIDDQFLAAATVLEVLGIDAASSRKRIEQGDRGLPADAIDQMMTADEPAWLRWLTDYQAAGAAIGKAYDLPQPRRLPDVTDWAEIRALILNEVVPHTHIKIVNSDPRADDRPQFDPVETASGQWRAAPDLSTIFVSGNVMSRGLTLEGLATVLFLRSSDDPYADTQMQMQRWFGYRGADLELCRVFLPAEQLDLFRAYHDADEALRRTVLAAMNDAGEEAPKPFVLGGADFSATGKLTNVANVPLCPGAAPFIRLVNSGKDRDPNVGVIARAFSPPSRDVVVRGRLRGRILDRPLPMEDVAVLLDELRYEHYRPTPDGWEGARWRDLAPKVGIDAITDPDGLLPFFRPPEVPAADATPYARGGPYAISAYLRLWKACVTRHARGLVATDEPRIPWSMANLRTKAQQEPKFYVAIRYGSGAEVEDGPLSDLPFRVKTLHRSATAGELEGAWGTRTPALGPGQYLGDELFDYHHHNSTPPPPSGPGEPRWRPPGAPGLILFHVVSQQLLPFPTVAVGVALPLGGPDQFAARPADTPTP